MAREQLSDHDGASQALVAALDEAPTSLPIAIELAEELERAGRFSELTTALQVIADLAEDPLARRRALVRMARNYELELDDEERALKVWREVVAETEDPRVLAEFAAEARRHGAWERLELMLASLIEHCPDPDRRAELFLERVDLLADQLVQPHIAMRLLKGCLANQDPPDRRVLDRLVALAEEADDHPTLARALEALLPRLEEDHDREPRIAALRCLADLYDGRLRRPRAAVRVLERWAEVAPRAAEPNRRLVPHCAKAADWEGFLQRLDRVLELEPLTRETAVHEAWGSVTSAEAALRNEATPEPELEANLGWLALELAERATAGAQQVELLTEGASHFSIAGRPELAFAAITESLRAGGRDEALLIKAEALALELDASVALDGLYEELLQNADPAEARILAVRHAALLEPTDPSLAFDRLRPVVRDTPQEEPVLDLAERVAEASGRTRELVELYREAAERLGAGATAIGLIERALQTSELDRATASVLFRMAVPLAAGDRDLFERIEAGALRLGIEAERSLAASYEQAAQSDSGATTEILKRGARWYDVTLGDLDAAYRCLRKALSLEPGDLDVLDSMEDVAARCDYLRLFDTLLRQLIEEADSDEAAAPLVRKRASVLHQHLRDPSTAADLYLRYAKHRPDDIAVSSALRGCLLASDRIDDLVRFVEQELAQHSDVDAQRKLLREIATLAEERLHDPERALDAWKRLLKTAPNDASAQTSVARLSGVLLKSLHPEHPDG